MKITLPWHGTPIPLRNARGRIHIEIYTPNDGALFGGPGNELAWSEDHEIKDEESGKPIYIVLYDFKGNGTSRVTVEGDFEFAESDYLIAQAVFPTTDEVSVEDMQRTLHARTLT